MQAANNIPHSTSDKTQSKSQIQPIILVEFRLALSCNWFRNISSFTLKKFFIRSLRCCGYIPLPCIDAYHHTVREGRHGTQPEDESLEVEAPMFFVKERTFEYRTGKGKSLPLELGWAPRVKSGIIPANPWYSFNNLLTLSGTCIASTSRGLVLLPEYNTE